MVPYYLDNFYRMAKRGIRPSKHRRDAPVARIPQSTEDIQGYQCYDITGPYAAAQLVERIQDRTGLLAPSNDETEECGEDTEMFWRHYPEPWNGCWFFSGRNYREKVHEPEFTDVRIVLKSNEPKRGIVQYHSTQRKHFPQTVRFERTDWRRTRTPRTRPN